MNAPTYKLDPEMARQGSGVSKRIETSGSLKGVFTLAMDITASTGTKGIKLEFEAQDGRQGNITLYTTKKDGTLIFGMKQLNAVMTCLGVRGIQPTPRTVMQRDFEQGKDLPVDAQVFADLENKPIGLVLQREEKAKTNEPGTYWVLNLIAPFNAETHKVATEILDQTNAEQLERIVDHVRDKPLVNSSQTQSAQNNSSQVPVGFDDFDDDIPF